MVMLLYTKSTNCTKINIYTCTSSQNTYNLENNVSE